MIAARRSPALPPSTAVAIAAGAAALGALFAVSAWAAGPLVVPGVLVAGALAVTTVRRPEVGVAVAFLLVPLSNLGLTGHPPWLLTSLWALFLCVLGLWRHWGTWPPLLAPIGAHLVVTIVAFLLGGAITNGLPELRATVTGLLYFFGIALLIRSERQVRWAVGGIAAAVLLVGLVALRQRMTGSATAVGFITPDGELVGRVDAGFGHPNALGGFLVILTPFCIAGALLYRRLRLLFGAALALGVFGIYASFSRSAMIAAVVIPFVFVRGRRVVLLAPLVAVAGILATPGLVRERFETLTQSGSEIATRVDFWTTAVSIWQEHPIFGVGLGQFPAAYAASRVPGRGFLPDSIGEPPPHAHNIFLQYLSTEGIIGFAAIVAIFAAAVFAAVAVRRAARRPWTILGSAFLASLVALLIQDQFDVTLLEGTGMYFWALLGLLSACFSIRPEPRRP